MNSATATLSGLPSPRRLLGHGALFGRLVAGRLAESRPGGPGLVSSVRTREPLVALTFDDGPDPVRTPAALAALAAHDARATFFVLGGRARRHPAVLAELTAAGHEVALHGPDHRLTTRLPPQDVVQGVLREIGQLEDVLGQPVRWYRPPYGQLTREVFEGLARADVTTVFWTRGARDWEDVPRSARVAAACRWARPGTIVLLHDGHADERDGAEPGPAPHRDLAVLVDDVVTEFAGRGLRSVTVSELVAAGSPAHRSHFAKQQSAPPSATG